jgi:hypothetical protein
MTLRLPGSAKVWATTAQVNSLVPQEVTLMSETGQTAGDQGGDQGGSSLEQHPLVEALVPDPSQGPPNATVLRGFLGKSTTEGVWRLYPTPALDEFVEIPEADILHSQQLPDDQGTVVWVPKGLQLQYIRTQARQIQADMLSGALATAHLAGTGPSAGGVVGPQPTPPIPIPTSAQWACPTPSALFRCWPPSLPFCRSEAMIHCWPSLPFCPSEAMIRCPSSPVICVSELTPCWRPSLPFCPSEIIPCTTIPGQGPVGDPLGGGA